MTNETPHWVKPQLVAQVRFTEWTDDGRLRHPAYLGLRDDKTPKDVRREAGRHAGHGGGRTPSGPSEAKTTAPKAKAARPAGRRRTPAGRRRRHSAEARQPRRSPHRHASSRWRRHCSSSSTSSIEIEAARKAKAVLALPDGDSLDVSNLHKVFWPSEGLTKGDLMRYYVQVSPFILPVVTDRPLVMKRYPDGVRSEAFYQHRAPDKAPPGVRIEVLPDDDVPSRPVGGTLKTLLYMTQLAAISQDPWFSRMPVAAHRGPHRLRSRSDAGHVVRDGARRRALAARRAGRRSARLASRRPRAPMASTCTSRCRSRRRTRRGGSGRRLSRRSWRPGTRRWPPSSAA